ncbi:uncharacterized protein MYCFIDRAFT_177855 [Pseudocercospora fijiensis CIRAD86]|uniref:Uncharacterized protein n=1 Tax=Pseudocercospora fijiensis (strain CIRAD86) TaxID=383855 RepID=M3A3K3_PSEFD|nr:uncharacterized protein MYCFIDRAFT_177855 [Pseudocercospora fijiensis CIRAD86]EME79216.1 hypothetical protein MYCFIDRAFT_177855 [Pseudocercospora fijiensis CIRAD86]
MVFERRPHRRRDNGNQDQMHIDQSNDTQELTLHSRRYQQSHAAFEASSDFFMNTDALQVLEEAPIAIRKEYDSAMSRRSSIVRRSLSRIPASLAISVKLLVQAIRFIDQGYYYIARPMVMTVPPAFQIEAFWRTHGVGMITSNQTTLSSPQLQVLHRELLKREGLFISFAPLEHNSESSPKEDVIRLLSFHPGKRPLCLPDINGEKSKRTLSEATGMTFCGSRVEGRTSSTVASYGIEELLTGPQSHWEVVDELIAQKQKSEQDPNLLRLGSMLDHLGWGLGPHGNRRISPRLLMPLQVPLQAPL